MEKILIDVSIRIQATVKNAPNKLSVLERVSKFIQEMDYSIISQSKEIVVEDTKVNDYVVKNISSFKD